jgi:hypothetical protein
MQVWYLLGWAAHLQHSVDQALEALDKARDLFVRNECEDSDVLRHIEELLQSLPREDPEPEAS